MATAADAAKDFATGPHAIEAARILLNQFPLPVLCEALANAKPEDAEYLWKAVTRLSDFQEVRPAFLSNEVARFLRQGAASTSAQARKQVAQLLVQLAQDGEGAAAQLAQADLLTACESLLLDEETGTAEAAARVILQAVKFPQGHQALLGQKGEGNSLTHRLQQRLSSLGDVERIRVLHLFVDLGKIAEDIFAELEARGVYKEVIGSFLTDDLLLKLNAVELMESLGSFPAGQEILGHHGIPEQLAKELEDPLCDQAARLCVVRLLGLILRRAPQTSSVLLPSHMVPFPQAVAAMLDSRDQAERLCGLNAWADSCCCPEGLGFFISWTPLMQEILSLTGSSQGEVCKGSMGCWLQVLKEHQTPPPAAEAPQDSPGGRLWTFAETRLLPVVLKNLASKPFPDVRSQTWRLLAEMVRSRRIAQQALPAQEMRDLLLDFTSESAADAKVAKHEFAQALERHQGQWLPAFLDEEVERILSEFTKQGPYWVPRDAAVLVSGRAG